jgi:cytochrome c oxidase cbb3-type subunit III
MADTNRLMEHEYDGIREYDNPTPGWWHAIFIASVVFALFYAMFWHTSPMAWSVQEAWDADQVAEYKRIFGSIGTLKGDEESIQRMRADARMMAIARGTFLANCAACHAPDGGGINGVNLTDDSYKNVKALPDIFTTISKGANAGAMPAWENRLGINERVLMAAYVANLRGTTPGTARAPEGSPIPAFPAVPAAEPDRAN